MFASATATNLLLHFSEHVLSSELIVMSLFTQIYAKEQLLYSHV